LPSGISDKGVTLVRLSTFQAFFEPLHALCSAAVRKRFRHHIPLCALLQAIIADLRGSVKRCCNIGLIDKSTFGGIMAPDAGKAVGLSFLSHRQGIAGHRIRSGALGLNPGTNPQQMLDVVSHFVGNHIGARKIARRPKAVAQLLEEAQVKIDFLIA
jgi:hypothetical protein